MARGGGGRGGEGGERRGGDHRQNGRGCRAGSGVADPCQKQSLLLCKIPTELKKHYRAGHAKT